VFEPPAPNLAIDEFGHQGAPAAFSYHAVQLSGEFFRNDDVHAASHSPTPRLTYRWPYAGRDPKAGLLPAMQRLSLGLCSSIIHHFKQRHDLIAGIARGPHSLCNLLLKIFDRSAVERRHFGDADQGRKGHPPQQAFELLFVEVADSLVFMNVD